MTCQTCERAEAFPHTVIFQSGCRECEARSIAQDPAAFEALRTHTMTDDYRALLSRIWPGWAREDHERVKAWSERLRA